MGGEAQWRLTSRRTEPVPGVAVSTLLSRLESGVAARARSRQWAVVLIVSLLLTMQETANQKRPASHRWAIGIFGFMTAGCVVMLLDLFRGRSGASPGPYWSLIVILSVGALALIALVLGGRRRWAYYVGSAALGIWSARSVYTVLWYLHHYITRGSSVSAPYFHLAERDQPLVVHQDVPVARQLLMVVAVGLLIWLFTRFAFGRPSRSYYGFDQREKV